MSKLLYSFFAVCFTAHHSLLTMEEQINSFTTEVQTIKADLKNNAYPAIVYENKEAEYVGVLQTFPQTIATNFFARIGDPDRNHLSLLLNALLGDTIKRENHLIQYFTDPLQSERRKHIITCHNVLHDELKSPIFDGYFCFSLESNIFATFNRPIKRYDNCMIILRHLNEEFKEKNICMPLDFAIDSIFLADKYLIVGSHIVESSRSSKKVKNKYHIDIFDATGFANNELVSPDNLNSDLSYNLSINIEDTDTNIDLNNAEKQDPVFTLKTVENKILFLHNQRTKKYISLNFDDRTEKTEEVDTTLIRYALTKNQYLKIFPILDKNIISPFHRINTLLDTKDNIIPIIKYENKHGHYVEVQQTCPVILTTNFFIKSEKKTLQEAYNYTVEEQQNFLRCFRMDVNKTYTTIIDEDAVCLFINNFLNCTEESQKELCLHYAVQPNADTNTQTIISCYGEAKDGMGVPGYERYRCFSLESRLLAIYTTYFSPQINADDRHKIVLRHLDNNKKKHILNINKKLKVASIFLEGYFLIVGSYIVESYNKMVKNKYHIDIYNAKQFAINVNTSNLDEKNSDITYCYGFDIEDENSLSVDEAEKNDPIFKLITTTSKHCIVQNQITEDYISIFYTEIEKALQTPGLRVTCTNSPSEGPKSINGSPETYPKNPIDKKDTKSWFSNGYVQRGLGGTALLIFLMGAYNYKKCLSLFKQICR